MSIFTDILEKLGLKKPAATPTTAPKSEKGKTSVPYKPGQSTPNAPVRPTSWSPTAIPARPAPMEMVDVVAKLDALAKKNPILEWKVSIVDLMALLGMDHKADDIKKLAIELGCPASELEDSYKRNVWTHKALLRKIAENGGNIPANLLD